MPSFEPVNDDHAITAVTATLLLDEYVEPAVLQRAADPNAPWREGLPATLPLPPVKVSLSGQEAEVPALQLAIVRPDARPIWAARFSGFEISVECTAYSRWNSVWDQMSRLLTDAYSLVREQQPDANILGFQLEVGDEFRSLASSYEPGDLIRRDGPLGAHAFQDPGLWHVNVGSLRLERKFRIIDTLNAKMTANKGEDSSPTPPFRFVVKHRQRVNPLREGEFLTLEDIVDVVVGLHQNNKDRLSAVLTPEMLKRVGLAL